MLRNSLQSLFVCNLITYAYDEATEDLSCAPENSLFWYDSGELCS